MVSIRILLFVVLALGAVLAIVGQSGSGLAPNLYAIMIIAVTATEVGCILIVFLERRRIGFHAFVKNSSLTETQTLALLRITSLTFKTDYVLVEDENHRKIVHAFLAIRDVPYLIDDLDQARRLQVVGSFVRMLATLNFPFSIIPRVIPISADAYLKRIGRHITDERLIASTEGTQANPARQARIQRLQRVYERLTKGERAKEVGFLAHVMLDGSDESQLVTQLESNVKTLASAMEASLGIRAERLRGFGMVEVIVEFFRAATVVRPSRTFKMLSWDLAHLIPLTKVKLPPIAKLVDGAYVGRTYGGVPVCLDLDSYSNPHGCSVGLTGTGKSTFLKTFLTRYYDLERIPILIIDYAGEYRDWVASRNGTVVDMSKDTINPFELGSATLADRIRQVVDSFQHNCEFRTINQKNAFAHYVARAYKDKGFKPSDRDTWRSEPPIIQDIIRMMEQDLDHLNQMKHVTVLSLIDRLQAVASDAFGIFGKSTVSINALTQGFTCVDLSRLTSSSLKDVIAWTVLQYIDSEMRIHGTQSKVRLVIALDEAWKLCRNESSLPVTIIKEGRKFGYSLWVSSQDATADLAESILANAGTAVIFRTQHPKYLNFFKSAYGLNEQELSRVQNLSVGEALVKLSDDPRSFFVKVEMEEIEPKEPVSTGNPATPDNQSHVLPPSEQTEHDLGPPPSGSDDMGEVERRMLEAVAGPRIQMITELYAKLGVSDYQANKSKKALLQKGVVASAVLPRLSGKGRSPETLVLTDTGVQLLRSLGVVVNESRSKGGLHHRYIVQWLVEQFEKEGWKASAEYDVGGGKRADILVNGIAVEVEMGKSDIIDNVKKNREEGLGVLVVSPSEVINSVASKLSGAGINVPVVTPDQAVSQIKLNSILRGKSN